MTRPYNKQSEYWDYRSQGLSQTEASLEAGVGTYNQGKGGVTTNNEAAKEAGSVSLSLDTTKYFSPSCVFKCANDTTMC